MSTPVFSKPVPPSKDTPPDHFEVLPPENKQRGAQNEALSHLVAYLMDNVFKVPGLQKRLGVNPFLDLIPVLGDGAATLIQLLTILEGARRGVPKIVLARMASNVLVNGAVGTIPLLGEAFAWWFRPSSRNYQLLLQHAPQAGTTAAQPSRGNAGHYLFVFGLLALVLIVMGVFIGIGFYILTALWHHITPVK